MIIPIYLSIRQDFWHDVRVLGTKRKMVQIHQMHLHHLHKLFTQNNITAKAAVFFIKITSAVILQGNVLNNLRTEAV